MSDPITAAPAQQPTTPADVQASADKATLDAAADMLAKRQAAQATLQACITAFATGEAAMKAGRLECGRLADVYVAQRLALGDKRDACVQAVAGELAKYASEPVDASNLIRGYHAYRLLALDTGIVETTLSYGHYYRVFTQLVERVDKDTPTERWVLLPGFETQAIALFRDCVVNGFTQAVCRDKVQELQREYANVQAAKLLAEEQAAHAKAEQAKAEHDRARAAQKAAEKAERDAKVALDKAAEDKRAEMTAALEAANRAKLLAQRNATEVAAAKAAAEREAQLAERRKAAADKAAERANQTPEQQRKRPQPTTEQPATQSNGKPPIHNPLVAAKHATAKDLAESIRDQICANKSPADVLCELAKAFDWREADAKAFANGLAANSGKHATAFAFRLAELLLDRLEAPPVARATAAA